MLLSSNFTAFSCFCTYVYVYINIYISESFAFIFFLACCQATSEVTVVVEDRLAGAPGELTVKQGQHLEVIDPAPPLPPVQSACTGVAWCLVRTLPPDGADPSQGLVPVDVLQPCPILQISGARNSVELEGLSTVIHLCLL